MGTAELNMDPYGKKGKGKGGGGTTGDWEREGFFLCFKLPLAAHMGVEAAKEGGAELTICMYHIL